jgi:hypothetical protein
MRNGLGLVTVKQKSVALCALVCASTLTALWLTLSEREPYGGASMQMDPETGVVVTTGTTSGFYYPPAGHVLTWALIWGAVAFAAVVLWYNRVRIRAWWSNMQIVEPALGGVDLVEGSDLLAGAESERLDH